MRKISCYSYTVIVVLALLFSLTVNMYPQSVEETNKYMLAQSFEQAGEYEKALKLYEELYSRTPGNIVYLQGFNRSLVQLKRYGRSEQLLKQELLSKPDDVNLVVLLGKTIFLQDREDETFTLWSAFAARNNAAHIYRHFSNACLEIRAFDNAIKFLKAGRALVSDKLQFTLDIAQLHTLQMNFTDAAREYALLIENQPMYASAVFGRITTLTAKPEFVDACLKVFEEYSSNNQFIQLLAYLYFEIHEYAKAVAYYQREDKIFNKGGMELQNVAERLQSVGAYPQASQLYSYLMKEYSSSSLLGIWRLGYAQCREQEVIALSGKANESWKPFKLPAVTDSLVRLEIVDQYLEIAQEFPNSETAYEAYYRSAVLLASVRKNENAEQLFFKIVTEYPLSSFAMQSYEQLAQLAISDGDSVRAAEYYLAQLSAPMGADGAKNSAAYNLAFLRFLTGNFPEARLLLETIGVEQTDPVANDALELLMLMNPMMNDSLSLARYAEAEWNILTGKYNRALMLLGQPAENQSFAVAEKAAVRKIELLIALNQYTQAVLACSALPPEKAKIWGDQVLYLKGLIYSFGMQDPVAATTAFQQLLISYPNSLYCSSAREQIIRITKKQS